MKNIIYILCFLSLSLNAQTDSLFISSIYKEALTKGHAHENLRSLCKDIGARLTGSAEAEMAVYWGKELLKSYGFDVRLQEVQVPHWERGTTEAAWVIDSEGIVKKIKVLALGGSIGTSGLLQGDIVEVKSIADLNEKGNLLKDKIVFINQKMDATQIRTFSAYGMCYPIRGNGASEAAKYGAKAVIIRSLAMPVDNHPHTGTLRYNEEFDKIPAAAISTQESEFLRESLKKGKVILKLEMDCRRYEDKTSYNVIGEWKGKTDKIITVGGHLDSWDVGEGAHDDGAGIVHSIEALRLLKVLGYQPKNTLRVVLFMNEENGNMGGETYAKKAKELGENHIIAIESDRGGFAPRGFSVDGSNQDLSMLRGFSNTFKPYDLHYFEKGYGGVDIGPLKKQYENITMFGFVPDSQRYFDFHHSENDVFENVNKRELELGAASIATLIYLLDKKLESKQIRTLKTISKHITKVDSLKAVILNEKTIEDEVSVNEFYKETNLSLMNELMKIHADSKKALSVIQIGLEFKTTDQDWEKVMFNHAPIVAASALLTSMKNDYIFLEQLLLETYDSNVKN